MFGKKIRLLKTPPSLSDTTKAVGKGCFGLARIVSGLMTGAGVGLLGGFLQEHNMVGVARMLARTSAEAGWKTMKESYADYKNARPSREYVEVDKKHLVGLAMTRIAEHAQADARKVKKARAFNDLGLVNRAELNVMLLHALADVENELDVHFEYAVDQLMHDRVIPATLVRQFIDMLLVEPA